MRAEINRYIVIDSKICHGTPTFKGTRVMVWQIIDLLGAGVTPEEILRDYFPHLTKESILAALNYVSKMVEEERYVIFQKQAKASL